MSNRMTVREINRVTRDGGNGLNVYFNNRRVTRAKTVGGEMFVKTLLDGRWYAVCEHDSLRVSL
jgi:hypothetical protein